MPLGFIGGSEFFWVILIALMLFGGRLPEVARDLGQLFFRAKRTLNEVRRESGIDDALNDLKREAREIERESRDIERGFRAAAGELTQDIDLSAGPGGKELASEADAETGAAGDPAHTEESNSPAESDNDSQEGPEVKP